MNTKLLFIILVLTIVITLLGTIALFQYLGVTFSNTDDDMILTRAAYVVT
jgi:flagellar basal body-associated protein FliL